MKKATMETEKGTIILELFPNEAPGTVANFEKLAKPKETHTSTEQVHYPWLMQEKTPVEASSLLPTAHNHT